jgi:hypothetical protein
MLCYLLHIHLYPRGPLSLGINWNYQRDYECQVYWHNDISEGLLRACIVPVYATFLVHTRGLQVYSVKYNHVKTQFRNFFVTHPLLYLFTDPCSYLVSKLLAFDVAHRLCSLHISATQNFILLGKNGRSLNWKVIYCLNYDHHSC